MSFAQELLDKYIQRIRVELPDELEDMADELTEVVRYPDVASWGLKFSVEKWLFLRDTGLPKLCPTMITLDTKAKDLGEYMQIGSNNYGDQVCIEKGTGAVVYLEHDTVGRSCLINQNPMTFLASVCAYTRNDLPGTREAIRKIDPEAVVKGQWWHNETAGE